MILLKLFKREQYLRKIRGFYDADDLIKVITGVRRCGKSSLMKTIVDELIERGVSRDNIIYIDLDKRGFKSIKTPDQLEKVIDQEIKSKELNYLFIDEIQNVKGFESLINGYRTDGGYSIFITGSNSYLLSSEISTKLTGRYISFEMFPLNFSEYVEMKKFYGKPIQPNTIIELNNYIIEGGFPRTIFFDEIADKRNYVANIVDEIFEKDIRRRVKIKNRELFNDVTRYMINNFAATTNIRSLHTILVKSGFVISEATVDKYVNTLVDAKILYECNRFDMKSKRSIRGDRKYYLSDLSFYFSMNTDNQLNYGPSLENIVYIYSKSKGYSVSIGRIGKLECDFILRDSELNYSYVQVSYTIALSKETEDREYRPLEQIKDNYPKYVATTDYILQRRNGIKHVNILEFMLNNQDF
ncbi:MAG: ATP-binding protein [Floccifex porci]|uniref:ATP-binding protein n=1 Tax=Floccifex porci TaxID=2606629 RepID=UPI002A8063A5|nr:ATP-binding protein [Floccifex porci]MDY4796801.1 ATP-binding protein [Floccifex porci]